MVARQEEAWNPPLAWAAHRFGAAYRTGTGIGAVRQPETVHAAMRAALAEADAYELAGLGAAVPLLGSLVLGLAVSRGAMVPERAHALALLEELWSAEHWGADRDAEARRDAIGREIAEAARFMELARNPRA